MTTISETAYPRLKTKFTDNDLVFNFKPNEDELELMEKSTQKTSDETRLGFMILLKCYQCLGRPIATNKVPKPIIQYIAKTLNIDASSISLSHYDKTRSRRRHIGKIRDYRQINTNEVERKQCLKTAALNSAATKENIADIINDMLEELIKNYFELPAFDSLLRLAKASRVVINNHYFTKISRTLSQEAKEFIDTLFVTDTSSESSLWNKIKKDPQKPTLQNVKNFVYHTNNLKEMRLKLNIDINFIPSRRIEHLVSEAISLDASEMRNIKPERRYSLASIMILSKTANAIDDLVSILIRWMKKLHNTGSQNLNEYRIKNLPKTDKLIDLLHQILTNYKTAETTKQKLQAVENCIISADDNAIEQCETYMLYADDNYYPFMLKTYNNKRSVIFEILEQLNLRSASQDESIIRGLEFIFAHKNSHKEWLNIKYCKEGQNIITDLNFLPEKWVKSVTGKTKGSKFTKIHRKYFELAVLSTLVDDLSCGDVYVDDANLYDNPNKQFMTWEQFNDEIEEYCSLVKIPSKREDAINFLQNKLNDTAKLVNDSYQSNEYLSIKNNEPVVKKSPPKELPRDLDKISLAIAEKMPLTNIVDIMVDVEKCLNISSCFRPLSGYATKILNYKQRFVATSFAYGCNIGPTESERCLPGFSRKQIAKLFNKHINEARLEKASEKVINRFKKFELPGKWGTGESVSADGTHYDMYKQNIMAEYHIRYGSYGGLGYYHISDLYIALYGNFIPCGVYEGNYLFDGIIANDSDVQPNKVHGDTGVQNEVIFGFALLLGIQLMPRIRNFKHLRYYKASKKIKYDHIDEIFTDESIDWDLIKLHYYDMLRLVMSIRSGRIKASTILRKLCSKSRKNKLYFAFKELGRVARTIFLLNYINDIDVRRVIQAATCKNEEFNDFISWIRFGGGGTIADNMRYNQQKIIKYGQLVANMVMLHVVANMTKVINTLRSDGLDIGDEILKHLSPFRTEHINRLGIFQLNIDKMSMDLGGYK